MRGIVGRSNSAFIKICNQWKQKKVRSSVAYWHTFHNGSTLKVEAIHNGRVLETRFKPWEKLKDYDTVAFVIKRSRVKEVLSGPLGAMPVMEVYETETKAVSVERFKQIIIDFWQNGPSHVPVI